MNEIFISGIWERNARERCEASWDNPRMQRKAPEEMRSIFEALLMSEGENGW